MNVANRAVRLWVGVLSWGIAAVLFGGMLASRPESSRTESQVSVTRYLLTPSRHLLASDGTGLVARNDPVFIREPSGSWRQVGHVRDVVAGGAGSNVSMLWYGEELDPRSWEFLLHQQRGGFDEVLAAMLPAAKRERVRRVLTEAMADHGDQVIAALWPLVEQTFRESLPIIETEFRNSIGRHREEIDELSKRLHRELVAERLVPLAKREILPIVRRHAEPPMEEIGRELWDRASLWRFGWRAMYDKSPLPRRDMIREEWERFIEQEAIPVFEAHLDDLVVAVERTLADVAANPSVRTELASELERLASDPEANRVARTILRETFVENPQLHERWRQIWSDEAAREVLADVGERLEPAIRQIGDELFGTRERGIDPDFARVLRSQILGKDRRWLVARPLPDGSSGDAQRLPSIVLAPTTMGYPVVYLAVEAVGNSR